MDDLTYDCHLERAERFLRSCLKSALAGAVKEAIELAGHAREETALAIAELYLIEARRA